MRIRRLTGSIGDNGLSGMRASIFGWGAIRGAGILKELEAWSIYRIEATPESEQTREAERAFFV